MGGNRIDVLLNGDEIFPAKLELIKARRRRSTTPSTSSRKVSPPTTWRARWPSAAGPASRSMSWSTPSARWRCPPGSARLMTEAGCRVETFRPLRPFTLDTRQLPQPSPHPRGGRAVGITGGSGTSGKWSGNGRTEGPMARHRRPGRGARRRAVAGRLRRELARGDGRRDWAAPSISPGQEARGPVDAQAVRSSPRAAASRCTRCSSSPWRRPAVHPHHQPLLRARRQDDRDPRAAAHRGVRVVLHPARERSTTTSSARRAAVELGRLLRRGSRSTSTGPRSFTPRPW